MKLISKLWKFLPYLAFFLVAFFPFIAPASSNLAILNWQENTNLTDEGKNSAIAIQGKIHGLLPNQVMTSFAIIFDERRNINISKVICDNRLASYSFNRNQLKIQLPQAKGNDSIASIYISYGEKYDKINKFLRQEAIQIPEFAAGANAKVTINFPWSLESATLNPNIVRAGNSFIYSNIVPQKGVEELIRLTPAQAIWDVVVKIKIKSDESLGETNVTIPNYFQNSGQKVENLVITSSLIPIQQSNEGDAKNLKFDSLATEILIENSAIISTGKSHRNQILRTAATHLSFNEEESFLLSPILEQIKRDQQYQGLPLYAKIGKFVHEFIKYDLSYTGKLPSLSEILKNPIGVCTEYAKLYNALARIAGIPAIIVNGAACGDEKCRGHAWNMIYQNNQWISVDATWDLMSGIVSSSHVYFSDDGKDKVGIEYFGNGKKVESEIDFKMKPKTAAH